MNGEVHLFSLASEHTTARYFERAICAATSRSPVYHAGRWNTRSLGHDDVVLFIDPAPDWPLGLERAPCLTAAYLIDVHQDLELRLKLSKLFDLVFVAQRDYVSAFRDAGHPNVHWLPLGCDPKMCSDALGERPIDVGFVGKLGSRGSRRHATLSAILPSYRTNDYSLFCSPSEMARLYGQSKIVFNASINGDLNMRVFEGLAAGALLVTDRIGNGLSEMFVDGVHYVGYSSIAEAKQKIDFYLADAIARSKIAAEGQRCVLTHHTYMLRWQEIISRFEGSRGLALGRGFSSRKLSRLYAEIFSTLRSPGRIAESSFRYGLDFPVAFEFAKACGRWLNSRVPVTPNAIQARIRTMS